MLLDTFRVSKKPNPLLRFHVQRTLETFKFLEISIPQEEILRIYTQIFSNHWADDQKCRLQIDLQTKLKYEFQKQSIETLNPELRIAVAQTHNQISGRGLQNYKTNQREYWENNRNPLVDDVIGVNDQGQITETSRYNIFMKQSGRFLTPSLDSGCLNGCLRQFMLEQGTALEKDFSLTELAEADIYVGNSLRGLQKAILVIN